MRQTLAAPQTVLPLPDGAAGTRATLKLMARLAREYRVNPMILMTARDLAAFADGGDYTGEVNSIFQFVRDRIRYIQDTNGYEVIHAPDELLSSLAGDCDDKSLLLATLLESIGHPARFVAVGYNSPGSFEHVFVETKIGARWIPLETTPIDGMAVEMGWAPVPPMVDTRVMAYMVEWI